MGENQGNPKRHIRMRELVKLVGLSRSSIYEKMKSDDFPQQVKLSVRSSAWIMSEVEDWIQEKIDARPALKRSSKE